MSNPSELPHDELDKWAKVSNDASTILNFLEWREHQTDLVGRDMDWVCHYFDIDQKKLEDQRQALLDSL